MLGGQGGCGAPEPAQGTGTDSCPVTSTLLPAAASPGAPRAEGQQSLAAGQLSQDTLPGPARSSGAGTADSHRENLRPSPSPRHGPGPLLPVANAPESPRARQDQPARAGRGDRHGTAWAGRGGEGCTARPGLGGEGRTARPGFCCTAAGNGRVEREDAGGQSWARVRMLGAME